jgi:hypothetical protein
MKWPEINATPCGILRFGMPQVVAITGENQTPAFLWYWTGDMNIAVIPGGSFDEKTGAVTDATGGIFGWITPLNDMPEITDLNQAMARHAEIKAEAASEGFKIYLEEQIQMAVNGIKAGLI